MPSESNTSYDRYILDQSCYTPSWLFWGGGGGGVVPFSREARSYFYTLGFPRGMFFKFIYTVVHM